MEHRFGTIFAATRTSLAAGGLSKNLLSVAYLDAIDKSKFLPIKRNDGGTTIPNSEIKGEPQSAKHLLPFGKHGFVIDTTPKKKKLEDRAPKARYLRAISETQYLVLIPENGTTRLVRSCEFMLKAEMTRRILLQNQISTEYAAYSAPFCVAAIWSCAFQTRDSGLK